jgi:hypothetical protein
MKQFSAKFALALSAAAGQALAASTQGISEDLYNRLVEMATISQAAYANMCNIPSTITVGEKIYNAQTDINGWVLRDDSTKEIITVFRGTGSDTNLQLDTNYTLTPFSTFSECSGCEVHGGYFIGWSSVQDQVMSLVKEQADQYPDYTLTVTGHRYELCPLTRKVHCMFCTNSMAQSGSVNGDSRCRPAVRYIRQHHPVHVRRTAQRQRGLRVVHERQVHGHERGHDQVLPGHSFQRRDPEPAPG